ncbi:MAG: EthD family reductase [Psychroserpens sp.]|uniref:EthD family reductase n=1 Tax=Psychroserpens sp. TaxID=2020870 RepID=UPI00300248E3
MVKLIALYGHPADSAAFEAYYSETHLPIASKIKGVSRVELTKFIGTPDGGKPSQYRMAELYFDSIEELQKQMGSPEGQATVNDIPNFATGGVDVMIGDVQS